MSDEELDALFQRGAAAYPDEMPAAAWAHMETKLDDAARTQALRRKVGRFFAGELLVLALVLWQVVRFTTPTANPAATLRQPTAAQTLAHATAATPATATRGSSLTKSVTRRTATTLTPSSSTPTTKLTTASGPTLNPTPAPSAYATAKSSAAPGHSTAAALTQPAAWAKRGARARASEIAHSPATNPSFATLISAPAARQQRAQTTRQVFAATTSAQAKVAVARLVQKKSSGQQRLKPTQLFVIVGERSTSLPATSASAPEQATAPGARAQIDPLTGRVASLSLAPYPLPDLLRQLAVQRPAADTTPPQRRAPRPPYRVLVGVLAGPSFSGVRTAQSAQLGADYGLTLDYRFSPKWRVRAGLVSSQKRYMAASTDYEAPAAWQWFGGAYDLTANCRITEIPLDLRYDLLSKPAYTLFTSLGLNSLLMRNERYSYDWMANGQTFTKSAEVRKGSNHFLSALNVSVGFEKPLGQRWSAQVEPFWQFPLGGVGAGKVRLTSAGASFSLKFGLVK
jgi:hypothetical protein